MSVRRHGGDGEEDTEQKRKEIYDESKNTPPARERNNEAEL
jgi:hypothetical protein